MSITTHTLRMITNQSNDLQSQFLCNFKFSVDLSISGDYLCLKILVPMSEIQEYNPSLLENLTSLGLDIEESFMNVKLENVITSIYQNRVFDAYKFIEVMNQINLIPVQENTSVEMVDYEEDNPALAFRFVLSSSNNSDLADEGLDIFEYITLDTARMMFRPLFDLFDTCNKRMTFLEEAVHIMNTPLKNQGLDGLFHMLIHEQR